MEIKFDEMNLILIIYKQLLSQGIFYNVNSMKNTSGDVIRISEYHMTILECFIVQCLNNLNMKLLLNGN